LRRLKGEGSLLKLKGCRFWYASYYQGTRQIKVSTKKVVKQEALAVLRDLLAKRDQGIAPPSDVRKVTYADLRAGLLANYIERGNKSLLTDADGVEYIPGLRQLDRFMNYDGNGSKGPSVMDISTETGRAFVKARQEEGAGNGVINNSLAALRRMLRIAHEEGKIHNVPVIRFLKAPAPRRGFVELDKFLELRGALPSHLRPLVTFLYYCGVRVAEALAIEWTQVNLAGRVVTLEADQTKTEEERHVPLTAELVMMLEEIEPKVGRVFSGTNLRKEWCSACAAVGLGRKIPVDGKPYDPLYEGLVIHDMRRSAVRNLVNAGVPERVAMKISGHKTRSVFDRYHIVSTEDVTAAMRKLEAASVAGGQKSSFPKRKVKLGKNRQRRLPAKTAN
jgi:integrase